MSALPELVGVVGGGRMGAGIAHAFLATGCEVVVREADPDSAQAAAARIEKSIRTAIERGTVTESWPAVSSRLRVVTSFEELADRALVIEAVPEIIELKADVLTAVEKSVAPECVLASNTSSLSIDTLAGALDAPQRFIGLHFFNPVPTSELVEIVNGARTDPQLRADAVRWVNALGKQAVSVRDSPGFATSRLGVVIALEAMRMLEEGVASAEDIDTAMKLGYKHPVGPLALTDIVGLDVRLDIAGHLADTLGPRFAPPAILRELVAQGHTGRKAGRGFYVY
ncbi:3-hydroxyacyl-CoA dehydrogenase family protein [Mycolicibacterium komossense]|uniref:3-hydroxyacyl-CoA dehydrogenase family protein n=1 Tax=Mycolicibacterium komossense TaxID=1779 RepID=A0ABT3CKH8_9MYCO|nr:3-hydroxyacyl-CoA dehydrogenase family protein [Mycolicibacterium komossense]MCV7230069.1 3-hydroxyacyl-CoA dehydrogenase family protein [Mycolicibacterium komossense]